MSAFDFKSQNCGNYEELSSMSSDDNNKSKVFIVTFIIFSVLGMRRSSDRVQPKRGQVKWSQGI